MSCWRKWRVSLGNILLFLFFFFSFIQEKSPICQTAAEKEFGEIISATISQHRWQVFGIRNGGREFLVKLCTDHWMYLHDYLFSVEVIWFHFWEHRLPQNKTLILFVFYLLILTFCCLQETLIILKWQANLKYLNTHAHDSSFSLSLFPPHIHKQYYWWFLAVILIYIIFQVFSTYVTFSII